MAHRPRRMELAQKMNALNRQVGGQDDFTPGCNARQRGIIPDAERKACCSPSCEPLKPINEFSFRLKHGDDCSQGFGDGGWGMGDGELRPILSLIAFLSAYNCLAREIAVPVISSNSVLLMNFSLKAISSSV